MLKSLAKPGDYFIPSMRYLHERIQGMQFIVRTYRSKAHYEAKVVVRLGPDQVVAFNVPTGDFSTEPRADDLHGPGDSMIALSEMLSYFHENALIPLVLIKSAASLSLNRSVEILEVFARRLLYE